ncbi:hypothetical protein MesoLjLc_45730 [Mesorhizobium sp. L-8-10]|uniref:hypothetical protein n=1 Tax=Mesorhizobium sp. L-8-10 TaxID=2744523 RepID=UPI001938AC3E|nr:hypothetical protein [Mesorhizobium sp. L-8-10]BCH32643.1 hypothetical protein MesoLjLc_45730 [Mesorhizobium sp. L-8-10]
MAFFTPDQVAQLSAGVVRLDLLVEFQFASGTERVWNGNSELTTSGNLWKPMFRAGRIEGIGISGGTASETVTFTLNGLPGQSPDFLAKALEETPEVEQQFVIVYLQLFDEDWQPVGAPIGIWWGFMQPPKVSRTPMQDIEGGTQAITLVAENAFFNRSRPPNGRYTDRDQQTRSPGDKFFQFTPSLLFKTFVWPDF